MDGFVTCRLCKAEGFIDIKVGNESTTIVCPRCGGDKLVPAYLYIQEALRKDTFFLRGHAVGIAVESSVILLLLTTGRGTFEFFLILAFFLSISLMFFLSNLRRYLSNIESLALLKEAGFIETEKLKHFLDEEAANTTYTFDGESITRSVAYEVELKE